ncbi:MAG: hypothetical protein M3S32_00315 [Acidobacteriota bacterium]|nr:hypothetical protein [Acidobacteriota bacterium]
MNRGAVYGKGRIYHNTPDDHTVAVDAATGQEVRRTRVGCINRGDRPPRRSRQEPQAGSSRTRRTASAAALLDGGRLPLAGGLSRR